MSVLHCKLLCTPTVRVLMLNCDRFEKQRSRVQAVLDTLKVKLEERKKEQSRLLDTCQGGWWFWYVLVFFRCIGGFWILDVSGVTLALARSGGRGGT